MNRQIKTLTVTYDDGTVDHWEGTGSMQAIRTPKAAQGLPNPSDSDVSYINAVLVYDRAERAAVQAAAAPVEAPTPGEGGA